MMTQSEQIYLKAREHLLTAPDTLVTEDLIKEIIEDTYPDLNFIEQNSLAQSINLSSLLEDVQETLKEEESSRDPYAHVGMNRRDFV